MRKPTLLSEQSLREQNRLMLPVLQMWQLVFELAKHEGRQSLVAMLNTEGDNLEQNIRTLLSWLTPINSVQIQGHPEQLSPLVANSADKDKNLKTKGALITQTWQDFFKPTSNTTDKAKNKALLLESTLAAGIILPLPDVDSHALVVGQYAGLEKRFNQNCDNTLDTLKTNAWIVPKEILQSNPSYDMQQDRTLDTQNRKAEHPTKKAIIIRESESFDLDVLKNLEVRSPEFVCSLCSKSFLEAYLEQSFLSLALMRETCFLFPSKMKVLSLAFEMEHALTKQSDCQQTKARGFSEKLGESLTAFARFYAFTPLDSAQLNSAGQREIDYAPGQKGAQAANFLLKDWEDSCGRVLVKLGSLIPIDHRLMGKVLELSSRQNTALTDRDFEDLEPSLAPVGKLIATWKKGNIDAPCAN